MPATRKLNKAMRTQLIQLIVRKAFTEKWEAHERAAADVADKVYFEVVGHANANSMLAMPAGFFMMDDHIYVKHEDLERRPKREEHSWAEKWVTVQNMQMTKERPIPYASGAMFNFEEKPLSKVNKLVTDHAKAQEKLLMETHEYRETVQQLLYSVGTIEKLLEEWPGSEEFVQVVIGTPVKQYPVVEGGLVERVQAKLMGVAK